MDIEKLRGEIDKLDDELAALVQRGELVVQAIDLAAKLLNVHRLEDSALPAPR